VNRITQWLPARIDLRIRVFIWLSLITEIGIVGTGGAVRLTGSGLGCPTWPKCTAESLVNTPEMGIHGIIEFANRTLTGVVGIIALVAVVLLWNLRKQRKDMFVPAVIVLLGVIFQAVLGGITVLTGLNPFIVGAHFLVSTAMVAVAAALVARSYFTGGKRTRSVPVWFSALTHVTTLFLVITVVVGVLTTASGPHSGDVNAARTGFDAELLQHFHAWPGYVTFALTLLLLTASFAQKLPVNRWFAALMAVLLVQIAVGLLQANTGLPPLLVGSHMVLACILVAVMTRVVLGLKDPVAPITDDAPVTRVAAHSG
jgi:heme A synthase